MIQSWLNDLEEKPIMNKKKVILFIILIVIAFFVYNYFRTGQFTLFPVSSSEGNHALKMLEDDFHNAAQSIAQAERSAAVSGLDTTSDVEAALASIRKIERELEMLERHADSDEMKAKIGKLKNEILMLKKRYK